MAKKKDALTNEPRLMNNISPSTSVSSAGGVLTFYPGATSGWKIIPANIGTEQYAVWRGYIDLAGYEMEQLTFVVLDVLKLVFSLRTLVCLSFI